MRALIVADGVPPERSQLDASWPGWDAAIDLVVAADGGARVAEGLGLKPELIVGDGDSLGPVELGRYRAAGAEILLSPVAKDESDTELSVLAAIARGADRVTILAAFGGRLDHALANIWLLALPALRDRSAELLDGSTRVTLIAATGDAPVRRVLSDGRAGDVVSLLPLDSIVDGIRTENLEYPLHDEPLIVGPSRGLSNVRGEGVVAVTVRRGRLLVIETPATLAE